MILVDLNESADIINSIKQSVPVSVMDLNRIHMSDYCFSNYEGKRFQFSRKQAGELLGNIDEAEDQLRDYYKNADENFQIVEGLISPVMLSDKSVHHKPITGLPDIYAFKSKMYSYQVQPDGLLCPGHSFDNLTAALLYAWIHRIAEAGITTYWTINWVETARLLVTIFKNEQKPAEEHSTLQRIIKPRIIIKEHSPFVTGLVLFSHSYKLGIGEKTAELIAKRFHSFSDLVIADVSEIIMPGIGELTSTKLLKALGRQDI